MLSIGIQNLAGQIVRHEMLRAQARPHLRQHAALHLNFDLGIGSYTNDKSYSVRRGLHLLYHVNPTGTYVSVFSGVTSSPFGKISEVKEWKHECTHDSCWMDINVFSANYFEMCAEINALRVGDGLPEIAPAAMSEHNSFRSMDSLFQWVAAEVTTDPMDDRNYKKLIRLL